MGDGFTEPPSLALRTGAPSLPLFTVREEPGSFLILVEPLIEPGGNDGRSRRASRASSRALFRRYRSSERT